MRRFLIRSGQSAAVLAVLAAAFWFSGLGLPGWLERLVIGARPPIVVGLLHSTTGAQSISEGWLQSAELMAIEEINARGGIAGRRVAWVAKDAGSDPMTASRSARAMIEEDGARVVFGCWTSEVRKAVQAVVEEKGSLLVFPANYEGMEQSRRTLYMGGVANQVIVPAVRWAADAMKARRFFVVGSEEIWSRAVAEIAKDSAKAAGAEVAGEAYLPLAGGGEDAAAGLIRAARPDLVLNMIVGDPNKAFLKAMGRAGLASDRLPMLCFGFGEDEVRLFEPGDVAGHYVGMNYFQSLDRPESRDFVRRFKARFGENRSVGDQVVAAYNGVILWARAVAESGTDDPVVVLAHAERQSLDAPEGIITIDPTTRVAWRPFHVGRARADGQFDIVYSILKPIRPSEYVGTRSIGQWRATLAGLRAGWGGRWAMPSGPGGGPGPIRTDQGARPE